MKIIDSQIVLCQRAEQLPFHINALIQKGWQPYGNVFRDEDQYFCILMVEYKEVSQSERLLKHNIDVVNGWLERTMKNNIVSDQDKEC